MSFGTFVDLGSKADWVTNKMLGLLKVDRGRKNDDDNRKLWRKVSASYVRSRLAAYDAAFGGVPRCLQHG